MLLLTRGRVGRAQTWHEPDHVERALDVSLGELGLDYGKSWTWYGVCGKAFADDEASGSVLDALLVLLALASCG